MCVGASVCLGELGLQKANLVGFFDRVCIARSASS